LRGNIPIGGEGGHGREHGDADSRSDQRPGGVHELKGVAQRRQTSLPQPRSQIRVDPIDARPSHQQVHHAWRHQNGHAAERWIGPSQPGIPMDLEAPEAGELNGEVQPGSQDGPPGKADDT